jgi:type I restriction enzyme S subunit
MSEWIQTSLSTIADIIPGFAFKSIHFGDEGYPVIKITDIRPPYVDIANANKVDVSKYGTKRLEKYLISKGDFILAMTGATIGKVGKVIENKTAYVNQRVAIIKPKNDVDKRFVYYCLQNNDFQNFIQNNIDSNSAQENISGTSIGRYEIMLPPIHEQKAIAGVLSSLDDKIDLLHRQNKTLEAMAEALFRQWFIEEAEDDWKEVSLKDIVELQSGFPFRSPSFTESGIYQIITIKAVQDGYLDLSNADRVKEVPDRMPPYCFLGIGDILLSLTGNVGRCCIVDSQGLLLNQRVAKIKPKNNFYKAFVYTYFRRYETKLQLIEMAKGTAQLNLSPIETSNIKIKLPPIQTLTMFNDIASPCFDRIVANKLVIRNITKLRDSILPKLMSGEVKVELE